MARPMDPDLERLWRRRLRRQAAGRLSVTAFCAREGVTLASFYYWKRRLAVPSPPASRPPDLFVPVRVLEPPQQPGASTTRGVILELPHRVRIRLEAPPEPEWLGRVVAALAELPDREATP
jgi:hypothetical protein